MGLAFSCVGRGDGVDDGLGFLVADFWVVGVFSVGCWAESATAVVGLVGVMAGDIWRGRLTLVVVDYISEMIAAAVVSFADAHTVVCEVHIAIVAKD